MKHRSISFILTLLLLLMLLGVPNVKANSNLVDLSKKGSINITLEESYGKSL